jgi:alpha-tubulin suppressor-like RCC1 family protein
MKTDLYRQLLATLTLGCLAATALSCSTGSQQVQSTSTEASGERFVDLAVGGHHACGVTEPGDAYCWGSNRFGQLGIGTDSLVSGPTQVMGLDEVVDISAGLTHSCALEADGDVFCWGWHQSHRHQQTYEWRRPVPMVAQGYLAPGYMGFPVDVGCASERPHRAQEQGASDAMLPPMTSIVSGPTHSCSLHASGGAYCWGDNEGFWAFEPTLRETVKRNVNGFTEATTCPTPIEDLGAPVKNIEAGFRGSCFVMTGGRVQCRTTDKRLQTLGSLDGVAAVSLGAERGCAVTEKGRLHCVGKNPGGTLVAGQADTVDSPTVIAGLSEVRMVSIAGHDQCAVVAGAIRCWGASFGKLQADPETEAEDGVEREKTAVVQSEDVGLTLELADVDHLELGGGMRVFDNEIQLTPGEGVFGCALTGSGLVHCWGDNQFGQLGSFEAGSNALARVSLGGSPSSGRAVAANETLPKSPETEACPKRLTYGAGSANNAMTIGADDRRRELRFEKAGAEVGEDYVRIFFPRLELSRRGGMLDESVQSDVFDRIRLVAQLPKAVASGKEAPDPDREYKAVLTLAGGTPWPKGIDCMPAPAPREGYVKLTELAPAKTDGTAGIVAGSFRFARTPQALGIIEGEFRASEFAADYRKSTVASGGQVRVASGEMLQPKGVKATVDLLEGQVTVESYRPDREFKLEDIYLIEPGIFYSGGRDPFVFEFSQVGPDGISGQIWQLSNPPLAKPTKPETFFLDRMPFATARLDAFEPEAYGATLQAKFSANFIEYSPRLPVERLGVDRALGDEPPADLWLKQAQKLKPETRALAAERTLLRAYNDAQPVWDAERFKGSVPDWKHIEVSTDPDNGHFVVHAEDRQSQSTTEVHLGDGSLLPARRITRMETSYDGLRGVAGHSSRVPTTITVEYEEDGLRIIAENKVQGRHEKKVSYEGRSLHRPVLDANQLLATLPQLPLETGYRTAFTELYLWSFQNKARSFTFKPDDTTSRELVPVGVRIGFHQVRLEVVGEQIYELQGNSYQAYEVLVRT